MRTKQLSVKRTLHILEPKLSYKAWREYITAQVGSTITEPERALLEAQRVLTNDARYITPRAAISRKQWINADRIVYGIFIAATLIACLIWRG